MKTAQHAIRLVLSCLVLVTAAHVSAAQTPSVPRLLVLILVAAMFPMAAVIGPIARMHAPPAEMPVTHSHDDPPGASHHHGHSGTINPEPDHGHH